MAGPEENDIRGLEIDKVVKAVKFVEYVFKNDVAIVPTKSDAIRWYNKTSYGTLSATSPSTTSNISPLSRFQTLETDITRNTSFIRKYAVTDFISMEDIQGADINILDITVMELTRVIIRDVDTRIYNVMTQDRKNPATTDATLKTSINMITTSGGWTDGASNPIRDIFEAQQTLWLSGGYAAGNPTLYLSPQDYTNLRSYLVFAKGSNIPQMSSGLAASGVLAQLGGVNIKVSPNVTADYAVMALPSIAVQWKQFTDTTVKVIDHPGLGKEVRVYELGEAILTSPKAVCLISNTQ